MTRAKQQRHHRSPAGREEFRSFSPRTSMRADRSRFPMHPFLCATSRSASTTHSAWRSPYPENWEPCSAAIRSLRLQPIAPRECTTGTGPTGHSNVYPRRSELASRSGPMSSTGTAGTPGPGTDCPWVQEATRPSVERTGELRMGPGPSSHTQKHLRNFGHSSGSD